MRANRKRSKRMSVAASHTMHVFGVIVVLFAMVILNMLASSSCSQLQKEIGRKGQVIKTLDNDLRREIGRWDAMKTLDRMETSLVRLGLNMKYPKSVQIIRMNERGEPLPAQNSVAEARRRQGRNVAVAQSGGYRAAVPAALRPTAPARVRAGRRVRR